MLGVGLGRNVCIIVVDEVGMVGQPAHPKHYQHHYEHDADLVIKQLETTLFEDTILPFSWF